MNRRLIPALLLLISGLSLLLLIGHPSFAQSDKPDAEVTTARRNALELAGAFTNAGFKLRDGYWGGAIKVGDGKLVQVNLYAGNEYYFSVAGADKSKKVALSVFDETGAPITIEEPYQEGATAAVGFSPTASGPYYIKVEEVEGEPSAFCLVCSYK